jgi:glycosyltransferase involved in cell wall biosynthesis
MNVASARFALLVPCKDGARFLPRLFASAAAQTRAFDEIVVFDDGSSDGSSDVARSLGARVIRSSVNVGPAAARNRLTESSTCEWLHFHDADDELDPRYLERVSSVAGDDTDLILCDMLWLEESTGQVDIRWTYDAAALASDPASYLIVNPVGGINGLYRRLTLMEAGGFEESLRYWEDLDLHLRLAHRRVRTRILNETLVTAHRREASHSNANLRAVWLAKLGLMERMLPSAPPRLRATLAVEGERVAHRLAALGHWRDVPTALALCQRAGGNPPSTHSTGLRLLKRVLPSTVTFGLQARLRHHLAR